MQNVHDDNYFNVMRATGLPRAAPRSHARDPPETGSRTSGTACARDTRH
jgi:hypothetical protein